MKVKYLEEGVLFSNSPSGNVWANGNLRELSQNNYGIGFNHDTNTEGVQMRRPHLFANNCKCFRKMHH